MKTEQQKSNFIISDVMRSSHPITCSEHTPKMAAQELMSEYNIALLNEIYENEKRMPVVKKLCKMRIRNMIDQVIEMESPLKQEILNWWIDVEKCVENYA
jgi:hypothetical protein